MPMNWFLTLLNEFLSYIDSLYPSIKFTLEIGDLQITFLDLTISIRHDLAKNAVLLPNVSSSHLPTNRIFLYL